MNEIYKERIKYFKKHVGHDYIIKITDGYDFLEITSVHGGDINMNRVYGNNEEEFRITER